MLSISCSKQKIFNVKYQGIVYDRNGNPIKGANVSLSACYPFDGHNQCDTFEIGTAITNDSGHFKIKAKAARSGRYWVTVNAGNHGFIMTEGLPKEIHMDK